MMTAAEAKERWCPFARTIAVTEEKLPYHAGNRVMAHFSEAGQRVYQGSNNPPGSRCIAGECMAWRWREYHDCGKDGITTSSGPAAQGYCGLAGNPLPPPTPEAD